MILQLPKLTPFYNIKNKSLIEFARDYISYVNLNKNTITNINFL